MLVFIFLVSFVEAHEFESEYSNAGEEVTTYSITHNGKLYEVFSYDGAIILFDSLQQRPLFNYTLDDKPTLLSIYQQEHYYVLYSELDDNLFQNLLSSNLGLDSSIPCKLINFEDILLDEGIIYAEEYAIKKYIPKECLKSSLDCKDVAHMLKEIGNNLGNIKNYATPTVIAAVYCKGEEGIVIPYIIEPAKQLDASLTNIKGRNYLTGQIESTGESKILLKEKLTYNITDPRALLKDVYFSLQGTRDFFISKWAGFKQLFTRAVNYGSDFFTGKKLLEEDDTEYKLWGEKLEETRNFVDGIFTETDLQESERYSQDQHEKAFDRIQEKIKRNEEIKINIDSVLKNQSTTELILFFSYNRTFWTTKESAILKYEQANVLHEIYKFNSAYKLYSESLDLAKQSIIEWKSANRSKELSIWKLLALAIVPTVIMIILLYFILRE